ncbi:MAG: diguanylate cyclase/phosphodiesterase with PAS/PAC sensor(s) [Rhodocyclaceae bacterium]|nr:MAG: diguanylate cyclase/phosphodiesterase with PAS/PAC sensor(s) [Rhodocyclaceae bacterium]TND01278.1 MAG: diguanylate cyclase/phosphodiesterase with PAS/PAC sensor(s) [Rhodocyclaceae bacterium]
MNPAGLAGEKAVTWLARLWARLSLIARVMFSASLALAVAGALLLLVSTGKEASFSRAQIEEQLAGEMDSALPAIAEWAVIGDYANIEQVLRLRVKRADIRYIAWTNASGNTLEALDKDVALHAPGWFVQWTGVSSPRESRALSIGGRNYGQLAIEMTATPALNRLWEAFLGHLFILAIALGLDFAGILLILKSGLRPLAALRQGARALENGEMSARITSRGSPELADVIAAFNRMAAALESTQEALRHESERLSVTLSSIGDGVLAADTEGRVTFMNPLAEALTGWKEEEALGHSVLEVFRIVSETSRDEVDCPVGRCLREGVVVGLANHTLLIARDGTERPIADSAAPIRHRDGRIAGAVLVFRDQTEERRTLDRLALAASVSEHSLNGVIITDAQQRIIEVNPAFTRITGYSRAETLGQTPRMLSSGRHDTDFYAAMWSEIQATGQWRGEIWNRHKDDKIFPEELSIVAVKDEEGTAIRYIGIFSDISQIKTQEAQLRQMAHYDPLTGLPNRMLLADRMKVALATAARSGEKLAVCYLDIDGFKPVNDTWGHATGDRLLQEVAGRMRDTVRGGDTVARLGGDEFVLLLANTTDLEQCEASLARILQSVTQPILIDGASLTITASVGITLFPDDKADADTLLRHADQAMYAAKEAGRNRFHLFDPRHDHATRARHSFLARMETALALGELCLHYQPKVDMRKGTVIGAEALIRWHHPERGMLLPAEFLPLLEGSALEIKIGEWVMNAALTQMDTWRAAGLTLPVSVNIAPPHLASADFLDRLKEQLDRHPGTPKNGLELEVLESVALDDIEHVSRLIAACQGIGVAFALDDFGTGYSSLTYLKRLPVGLIKIDQSFVRDMQGNSEERAIVAGVVGLADAFHSDVIAEGVETVEQGLMLIHLGCSLAQGYCIARPMPAHEMPGWIATWQPDPAWLQAPAA